MPGLKLKLRTLNPWTGLGRSSIHGRGIYARCTIPRGTRIIEYTGEKITKAEALRRAEKQMQRSRKGTHGAVYIFELNKRYDIDGNVPYNPARYINHSCAPNCEVRLHRGHIWIYALRKIPAGEEITYNYGYDLPDHELHPCRCSSPQCVGFILRRNLWRRLRKSLALRA